MTPLEDEVLDLRDQVYELLELNRKLLEAVAPTGAIFPPVWQLNPQQTIALALLWMRPGPVQSRLLHASITDTPVHADDSPIVRVTIYRLRQKLERFGIEIKTHSGHGYEILAQSREIIASSMKGRLKFFKTISPKVAAERPSQKISNNFHIVLASADNSNTV